MVEIYEQFWTEIHNEGCQYHQQGGRARPLELMSMGHLHKIYLRKWTGLEIVWGHIPIKWVLIVFHARLKVCGLTSIMNSWANAKKLPVQKHSWPFLLNFQQELCPAFTNVTISTNYSESTTHLIGTGFIGSYFYFLVWVVYAAIDFCLIRTTKEWKILLLVFLKGMY